MESEETFNALSARHVIEGLTMHNIEGSYGETREEALAKVLEMIPKDSLVSGGGSATLEEIGLLAALKSGNHRLPDPVGAWDGRERPLARDHSGRSQDDSPAGRNAAGRTFRSMA
jgi:hypothetical protein